VGRNTWRPAHVHFWISCPGYEPLITHLFEKGPSLLCTRAHPLRWPDARTAASAEARCRCRPAKRARVGEVSRCPGSRTSRSRSGGCVARAGGEYLHEDAVFAVVEDLVHAHLCIPVPSFGLARPGADGALWQVVEWAPRHDAQEAASLGLARAPFVKLVYDFKLAKRHS
jgi:hypothetical protein